jgi:MoxR-like ATPase
VTGLSWFNQQLQTFEFRAGPIFAQIVLADEINRATPRTQSALLEAMQEHQVTVDGVTRILARPFLVLATQNPIELEGTFPLPEAQLDRFLMRIRLGYPSRDEENQILERHATKNPLGEIAPVLSAQEIQDLIIARSQVRVESSVRDYIVRVVQATRTYEELTLGASPRAALGLYQASQAWAALRGRDYVIPDDVKAVAPNILTHRLIISPQAQLRGRQPDDMVTELVAHVSVPADAADSDMNKRKRSGTE